MDKEMEFKNKSIKEKVNGSFEMIIVLYVVSVAFAVFLMFAVKIVPSATEYFVLAGGIVVLAIITVCSILATLKRAKMLIHYIVEPVRELSSVAEKISGGELDIEIAYQSEDEIGELAEDFRKTATTLQRIIGDLNHILDAFAKEAGEWKKKVADSYREYRRLEKELKEADKDEAERAKEISFLEFEIDEIENAGITAAECQSVEEDYRRMMQGKRIAENLEEAYLYTAGEGGISAAEAIGRAVRAAAVAAEHDDKSGELYEQLVEVENLIGDSGRELRCYLDSLSFEPEQFYETESRLNQINHLKVKYGDSAEAILQHKADDEERLLILKNYDEYLNELKGKLKKSEERLQKECEGLSKIRKKEAKLLQAKIAEGLQDLNFLDVCFEIRFSKTSGYTVEGTDEVEFMISMNPGEPTRPLATVASGGELSRIMLAIKAVMADKDEIETLIFDEIDVGISGRTAQKVSEKMCLIGRKHQVICITHLAQIAAMADVHFMIEKKVIENETQTSIRQLDEKESIDELARILGGAKITQMVLDSAKEMRQLAKNARGHGFQNEPE